MAKTEQKLFLKPDDDIDVVIKKITSSRAGYIILRIPENSVLRSSADNFHTIKDEVSRAKKKLLIESIDPYIEEMATLAGIDSINPIFGKNERLISDIIPRSGVPSVRKYHATKRMSSETEREEAFSSFFSHERAPKKHKQRRIRSERSYRPRSKKQLAFSLAVIAFILVGGVVLATRVLPRATVVVLLEKTPLEFNTAVIVSSVAYEVNAEENKVTIPGELLTAIRNIEMQFPASGEEMVEQKATGELYIYNEYSSSPQTLVKTTRFETPDGKIYRLDDRVIVPGVTVDGGVITPSYIKVSVTADKSGETYNIQPDLDEVWNIPGFKEAGLMERYRGFYAKPVSAMTGGYMGTAFVPTENDISEARKKVVAALRNSLLAQMLVVESRELQLLEGSERFAVLRDEIKIDTGEAGTFRFFAEAEMQRIVFQESVLVNTLLDSLVSPLDYDFRIIEKDFTYQDILPDWDVGSLTFVVAGSFYVEPDVESSTIKAQLLNQDEMMIRSIIFTIPGLKKANISLWPFWVKRVPNNSEKVTVELQ